MFVSLICPKVVDVRVFLNPVSSYPVILVYKVWLVISSYCYQGHDFVIVLSLSVRLFSKCLCVIPRLASCFNVLLFQQHLQNIVLALVDELDQIVLEVYELYDDFDSEIGQDQQELEDLKKQLQQYKRTCRVLEYDLMR